MSTASGPVTPSIRRRLLLLVAALLLVVVAAYTVTRLSSTELPIPYDFAAFWAAGRLNAEGRNPYEAMSVRDLQRSVGLDDTAIMMWNPPWTLSLVMPVGVLPLSLAYQCWLAINFVLVLGSAEMLWRGLGGRPGQRGVSYVLTLTFVPSIFLLGSGQITAFVLFGLASFIWALHRNQTVAAGMLVAVTAIKPHLLGLFATWLLLEALRDRAGRRILLGGLVVGLVACIPPTLTNPDVWSQYIGTSTSSSTSDHYNFTHWTPPLVGWWLRSAVPGKPFWVQWVPFGLGISALVVGFLWANRSWLAPPADATRRVGWIVGLSLFTAPYGVWQYDLVLLLIPVLTEAVPLAARPSRKEIVIGVASLAAINGVALAMMLSRASFIWYVWFTPAILLVCYAMRTMRQMRQQNANAAA